MQPRLATPLRRPAQPLVLVHCHARLQPHRQEGTKQGQQHFSPHLTGSILCVAAAVTVQAGPSRLPLAATPPLFTGLAAARCCTHRPPPAPPPPPLPAPRSPTATLHVSSNQWTVDHHTSRHRPTRIQSQSSINTPASLPTAAACRHRRTRALSLFVCPLPSPPPLADATPSWWQLSQGRLRFWRHRRSRAWNRTGALPASARRQVHRSFSCTSRCACALACPLSPVWPVLSPPSRGHAPAWLPVALRCSRFSIADAQIDAED